MRYFNFLEAKIASKSMNDKNNTKKVENWEKTQKVIIS